MAKKNKENMQESRTKKIINIVVMSIEVLIIIACITLSIVVIIGSKSTTEELGSGMNLTVVLTGSMDGNLTDNSYPEASHPIGSFAEGDLLFIQALSSEEDFASLKVGDVITYLGNVKGTRQLITHRITRIEDHEVSGYVFYTLGDAERIEIDKSYTSEEEKNAEYISKSKKYLSDSIQGVVVGKVSKVGTIVAWFQNSNNFLWSVVIPLAVLLAYNVYELIRMIISARIKRIEQKSKEELESLKLSMAQSAAQSIDSSIEEEIKRKAIEEYLAKMNAQQAVAVEDKPSGDSKAETIGEKKEE